MNSPVVKTSQHEARVFILLLVILLLLEAGIRLFEDRLSGNIGHIFSIPELASEVSRFQQGPAIVFMGNSLTNNAIDPGIIDRALGAQLSSPTQVTKLTPDGTALSDWYCIYQNQLMSLDSSPAYIVIGFAWAQLSDQYPINPTRLGGFFCKSENISQLSQTGLTDHQQLLRFIAGSASHVYVNREAIRNRVLDALIPRYESITQLLNETDNSRQAAESEQLTHEYSYQLLEQLLRSIAESESRVILVAMPVLNNYDLDNRLVEVTENLQVPLLDMRHIDGLDEAMFEDSIHLNAGGRSRFSEHISGLIAPYLKNKIAVNQR